MSDSLAEIHEWRLYAECEGSDPELFFPKRGEPIHRARKICEACPVSVECLEDALDRKEPSGVRSGLSPNQRTVLLRKRESDKATQRPSKQ